ncbi:phage protein GemA/Gp16 family protein [Thalassospira lucentensis]|uniref:phage protein GemA/Gp16 family protein n=1 Tax=Thalassospira lucentensis TaxID=168935 RepID=UPI003AA82E1F
MPKSPTWQSLNRQIRAAEKERGIDRDAHEALVLQVTGKTSLGDCTDSEMRKIVAHLNGTRVGFKPSAKGYVRKIWALWGSLKKAGALSATDTDAALLVFVNKHLDGRQFANIRQLDWLTYDEAAPVIEALKDWDHRVKAGGAD